ncbi:BEM_collapsed_G0045380.mRNA.1.CDS.1 [Saccharomyces cerevisiae]|nr:BEM_collapsed_G0045380.mRNA.1.CDS.1 [Saccharomyces cerevisiae]
MACMVIFASIGVKCLYPHGQDGPSSKGAGNAMIVFTCLLYILLCDDMGPCCLYCGCRVIPFEGQI